MSLPVAAVASGIVMVLTGTFVFAARPRSRRSLVVLGLLALWGAATVASALYAAAPDAARASMFASVTLWYTIPLPLLLFAAARVVLDAPPTREERAIGALLAAATLLALAAYAARHDLFIAGIRRVGDAYTVTSAPLQYALTATFALVEAWITVRAVRTARAPETSPLLRERAVWIALATGVVSLHTGAFFVSFIAAGSPSTADALFWVRAVPTILAGAASLVALVWLARSAAPSLRRSAVAAALLLLALGSIDGLVGARRLQGVMYPGYETTNALVRVAFALLLSIAALRFGLADVGARGRRVVARASAVLLVLGAVAFAALAVLAIVGRTPLGLGVALAVGAAVPFPLRGAAERGGLALARGLLLPPDDPRAIAERARTYAAALAASRDAGPEGEKLLAQMRGDLGITLQEHELLASGVASRDEERYQRLQTLGRGATAQVELAMDEVAGRRVVVKRFTGLRDPAAVLKEARSLAAVRHPRVVPFLEVDRRGDDVFLVLAYAEGGSARQLLDREGPLPVPRALALARDLLEGLDALHAAGVVHCDVKPENLLLGSDGRGLLGDFGSARFVAPDLVDATLTGASAEGSLSTVSPEALRGAPPAPERDVYAVGALLYRLLTGEHYVDLADATVFQARERILMDEPRLPHPRVPAAVEDVLRKALAKAPAERYRSARAMLEALLTAEVRAPR